MAHGAILLSVHISLLFSIHRNCRATTASFKDLVKVAQENSTNLAAYVLFRGLATALVRYSKVQEFDKLEQHMSTAAHRAWVIIMLILVMNAWHCVVRGAMVKLKEQTKQKKINSLLAQNQQNNKKSYLS